MFKRKTFTAVCLVASLFFYSCSSNEAPQESIEKHTDTIVNKTEQYYYGLDVSHWNGNILEDINKLDGISFGICKATEGVTYIDPDYDSNRKILLEKGLIYGAYHFYMTDDDPVTQAEFYYHTIHKDDHKKQLACIVDIESGSIPTAKDKATIQEELLVFLNRIETLSGRVPMIYTSYDFAEQYLTESVFQNYPLWLAEYSGNETPLIPKAWKDKGYTIWQKTDHHDINSSLVDYDQYRGTLEALAEE